MSVEQHSAAHRVPGESLGERLGARGQHDRRVGPSDAFYARFGLTNPWMPDAPVGGADRDFGMVYLSSAAFLDHMASLADRREARIARVAGINRRFQRKKLSALRRSGAVVRSFSAWGNVGLLGESDLVVPQHPEPMVVDEEGTALPQAAGKVRGPTMRPVASPWLSFKSKPARVFGGSHRSTTGSDATPARSATGAPTLGGRPERAVAPRPLSPGLSPALQPRVARRARPLDRMAERVAAIDVQPVAVQAPPAGGVAPARSVARRAGVADRPAAAASTVARRGVTGRPVAAVAPSRTLAARAVVSDTASETAAPSLRAQRRSAVRNARRSLGPAARLAATRLEESLPDAAASPLALAASRMPRVGQRARGAQRALWGSPSASVLARPVAAAEPTEAERAPISRSPVKDTWTPARVVRQGASTATSTARSVQGTRTGAATARAMSRAAAPARPRPVAVADAPASGASTRTATPSARRAPSSGAARTRPSVVSGIGSSVRTAAQRAPVGLTSGAASHGASRRAVGTSAGGSRPLAAAGTPATTQRLSRLPSTARALDRARAPQAARLLAAPTGLSALAAPTAAASTAPASAARVTPASPASSPVLRAVSRVESATPDTGSVVPRPLPALRRRLDAPAAEESWLDAGFARETPKAVRRLSVARSSQGMFAPSAVVVTPEPAAPVEDDMAAAVPGPRAARTSATGARVVSGWSKNELPASTARVVRDGRPVDTASPARNAERRLQAAANASVTERAARTPARAASREATAPASAAGVSAPAAAARSASATATVRADRARPLAAAASREARPEPATASLRPTAVPRLSRRARRRASLPATGGVTLQPALAPTTEAGTDAPRGSVRAAGRSQSTPVVGRTAGRVLSARPTAARPVSRHARPNPVSHAAPRIAQTVRLTTALAQQLGVTRAGAQDATGGETSFLVSGATATRALAAARRGQPSADAPGSLGAQLAAEAVATARRGQVRRSQLWAPDQVTAQAAVAEPESDAPESTGAPRVSGFGERVERLERPAAGRRAPTGAPAGRPLDWIDDRTIAALPPAQRRAVAVAVAAGAPLPVSLAARLPAEVVETVAAATGTPLASRAAVGRRAATGVLPRATGARRGRHLVRTADGRYIPAAPSRRPATTAAGFVVPTPLAGPGATPVEEGRDPVTGAPVVNGWARPQASLSDTLASVEDRQSDAHLPVWARRASGTPLVGGANGDLVSALARASDPEEVVRVIMEKGDAGGTVASTLPKPALQVIEKIKTVAREEVSEAIRTEVQARTVAARKAGRRAESPRSTARVIQGFTGLRRGSSARRGSGVGDDQVMKLAKKLQSLIDLAEGRGDRNAARRQVRMAEDSAAARGEGQSSPATAEGGQESSVDIDALTRQVVEAATRELDQRRERRQEDSDERGFWW